MSQYYNKVTRTMALGYDPDSPDPDVVLLPPENVFWHPLPPGHEFTFDVDGIPDGTQPEPVPISYTIRLEAIAAGVTMERITAELFKQSQALPNDLANIYSAIQTIATNNSLTDAEVIDVLR